MKSKMSIKFAAGRQQWMGGMLVSCVLGMGSSSVASAEQILTGVKGPTPTAADDARLKASADALAKKLEDINAIFREFSSGPSISPGFAANNVKALYDNPGDGTLVTTRMLTERAIDQWSAIVDRQLGGVEAARAVKDGVKTGAAAIVQFGQQLESRGNYIADSLGGGASIRQEMMGVPTNDLKLPTFQAARVDENGNASASPTTSTNVADALVAVGESIKNTANAAVKYDSASNKTQLTLNRGGEAARLSNVQAGALSATSTDAVNGSQLSSSNERIGQLGTQLGQLATRTENDIAAVKAYSDAGVVSVRQSIDGVANELAAVGESVKNTAGTAVSYDDAGSKTQLTLNRGGEAARLSNVQAGALSATSTDAVNGSQLSSSNERIGQLDTQLGELATRTGNDIAAVKAYSDASVVSVRQSIDGVASELAAVGESVKNNASTAVSYDEASSKTQLTLNRGGEATRLSNVQAGALSATSTDAVNGSQLSSSNERIGQLGTQLGELSTRTGKDIAAAKAYTDANVVTVRQSIEAVQGVATQTAQSVGKVSAEVASLQKGVSGAFQTNARSSLRQSQASGKDAVAGGGAAQAAGDNSVAMGARARAESSGTTAVGGDAKAVASNSVALGANSVADRSSTVSVGQAGAERQITNVAAGSRGTDAVNLSQLTRATAAATEQANAYTDQRYAQLHRDLKHQDSTLSAGIAGAMAMASLPRSMVAGGSMTSVAVGNYRGESALAVGVSYVSPGGRWSTNFMGSTNTRNDAGAAVGVGYQW